MTNVSWKYVAALVVTLLTWALCGCGKSEPTVTFVRSACLTTPSGQTRHQHRAAYTSFIWVVTGQMQYGYHPSYHPSYHPPVHTRHPVPIFHPARDWDEELVVTTCKSQQWQEVRMPE